MSEPPQERKRHMNQGSGLVWWGGLCVGKKKAVIAWGRKFGTACHIFNCAKANQGERRGAKKKRGKGVLREEKSQEKGMGKKGERSGDERQKKQGGEIRQKRKEKKRKNKQ